METVQWFWQLAPTIVIAVFILVVMFSYLNEKVEIQELENNLINANFVYKCFSYNGVPGAIDESKLTEEQARLCFSKNTVGYVLRMNSITLKSDSEITSLLSVCSSLSRDFVCSNFTNYVLVNNKAPAVLNIEVINRVR